MLIPGSCHCGNISFKLDWSPEPKEIPARACGCSFCVKHGGVWTSCRTGSLEVRIKDSSVHTRYAFDTRTADFHICARCGAVPVVTSKVDGQTYAVVSVNAMDGVATDLLRSSSTSFDGEDQATRLARRKQNWIARVRFA
jgi:hypothetical protein